MSRSIDHENNVCGSLIFFIVFVEGNTKNINRVHVCLYAGVYSYLWYISQRWGRDPKFVSGGKSHHPKTWRQSSSTGGEFTDRHEQSDSVSANKKLNSYMNLIFCFRKPFPWNWILIVSLSLFQCTFKVCKRKKKRFKQTFYFDYII